VSVEEYLWNEDEVEGDIAAEKPEQVRIAEKNNSPLHSQTQKITTPS